MAVSTPSPPSPPSLPLPPSFDGRPVNLIIDSDPGVDDVLSFVFALCQPHVNLLAISLTFGNTTLDYARDNVLRTFHVLQRQYDETDDPAERAKWHRAFRQDAAKIDLSLGAEGPLGGRQRFTASYFHGRDGLSSISFHADDPFPLPLPPPGAGTAAAAAAATTATATPTPAPPHERYVPHPLRLSTKSSPDLILQHLATHEPGAVRIAAIGPVTNLALAWQKDPATFARVGLISVMGGALDVHGNTAPHSEFNTYADPWAAQVLFEESVGHEALRDKQGQRLPIELLPLDITSRHTVPYGRLVARQDTPLGKFTTSVFANPRKVTNSYAPSIEAFDASTHDQFQAHDPLAVAHACYAPQSSVARPSPQEDDERTDEQGWRYRERRFHVETEGRLTRGMCVVDRRAHGPKSSTATGRSRAELIAEEEASGGGGGGAVGATAPASHDAVAAAPPIPGLVSVVSESPRAGAWFQEAFCWALGV